MTEHVGHAHDKHHDRQHGAMAVAAPAGGVIDPVCGMTVDPKTAEHKAEYKGVTYYFCAAGRIGRLH